MGQDPEAIRREIEETRGDMGNTLDALGYKADVKSRAKDKVRGVMGRADEATPSAGDVKEKGRQAVGTAQENPLGLAIGAIAAGFIAGMLIPSTRVEDEKIGPVADQVKAKAAETGQQALDRGKQVAQDVAQQATETAKESGREHAQGVADDARQAAQDTREQVRSP